MWEAHAALTRPCGPGRAEPVPAAVREGRLAAVREGRLAAVREGRAAVRETGARARVPCA